MPAYSAILATALFSAGDATSHTAASDEGVTEQRTVALDLPVSLDDVFLGELVAQITGKRVAVRPDDLLALLQKELDESAAEAIRKTEINSDGFATLEALSAAGITIEYLPESLSLKVLLSASQRGIRQISIRRGIAVTPGGTMKPAKFSAGMTAIARFAYEHAQPAGDAGPAPISADLFGFANIGGFDGWTLTWEANIDTGRDGSIQRRNVALIKDDFDEATRLTIGDFRTRPLSNFQRSFDMVGVSFRRAYEDIQPFRTLLPRGRTSFTIERGANVIVEVDGLVAFDQQLPPGAYDLSDFPFASGSNNAVVTVDDGSGPREVAFLSTFVDNDLLGEGLSRFDLNVGLLSNGFSASPRYSDDPAIAASYDVGLSTNLTFGAHIETSFDLVQVSTSAVLGTPLGLFSGEAAASQSGDGLGSSFVFQYRNQFETGTLRHNVSAQVSWRNDSFQSLSGPEIMETSFDLRWLVQTRGFQFSADVSHRDTRFDRTQRLALGATWRMLNANWNLRAQTVRRRGQSDDHRATLSVSIPLGRTSRLRSRVGSTGDARIEYQRIGGFFVGESQSRAQINRTSEGLYGASGQFRFISNRAELEIDHETRETVNGVLSRSEMTVAFGVGYADGALQFGRPFDSGFVIVKRHENIKDNRASLQEGGLGEAAHSDIFGPPLVPLRAGYSNYTFSVDVADLQPGYDLGADRVEIFPGFRGGYRVDIGSDIRATVLLRLVTPDGEPVGLSTGRIFDVADGTEAGRFFTNRTGRLVAENLPPGTYRIKIDGQDDIAATLTISEGDTGIIQRGEITMELVQ